MSSSPTPPLRAVLFDLDGTLYHQRPLQRRMLVELAKAPLRGPVAALRTLRRLRTFRRKREELRALGRPERSLDELQFQIPAEELGDDPAGMRATVEEWMYERPLPHLPACRREDLRERLAELKGLGLELGCFSDYPVSAKLEALGIADLMPLQLAATDEDVNAFKPHPRGFLAAAEHWDLRPEEILYVGDRADVDGVGAGRAGMRAALLASPHSGEAGEDGAALELGNVTYHADLKGVVDVVSS